MKTSKSKIDPQRLGSKAVFISKLRTELLEKAGPIEVENNTAAKQKFNSMTAEEQLRFQTQRRLTGGDQWVLDLEIVPKNIADIKMSTAEFDVLKKIRSKADTGKLRKEVQQVDGDALINLMMPNLVNPNCKISACIAALLLATGRRTVEILKTAKFYLVAPQKADGYTCWFSGQVKEGLFEAKDYEIPLLCPYNMVATGLARVRRECDTANLDNAAVNLMYANSINYVLKKNSLNAHGLRTVYAMCTFAMLKKKMSLIGHISKVLGHVNPANAAYYQRMEVTNFTGPYVPADEVEEEKVQVEVDDTGGWDVTGKVELRKLKNIKSFMEYRKPMTASALRRYFGGTMGVFQRILAKNVDLVEAYNKSLN